MGAGFPIGLAVFIPGTQNPQTSAVGTPTNVPPQKIPVRANKDEGVINPIAEYMLREEVRAAHP
jgi:hypothetical protein